MDLEQVSKKLMPCPFCGGSAYIKKQDIWGVDFYFARCSTCRSHSARFSTGYDCFHHVKTTNSEAVQKAVNAWNKTFSRQSIVSTETA